LLPFTDFPPLRRGTTFIFGRFFVVFQVNEFIRRQINQPICSPQLSPQALEHRFGVLYGTFALLKLRGRLHLVLSRSAKSFV
jgi:hypothetical protein